MIRTLAQLLSRRFNLARRSSRQNARVRLNLDTLESRIVPQGTTVYVVPMGSPTDGSHFTTLTDAATAAGAGGTVIVEGDAAPDPNPVTITEANLTIRGDGGMVSSPYFGPLDSLVISANGVSISKMNLQSVTITAGNGDLSLMNSTVNSVTEGTMSGTTQIGGNIIEFDRIFGSVSLTGSSGSTGDTLENDIFTGSNAEAASGATTPTALLSLTDDSNTIVMNNEFGTGGTFGPGGALGQVSAGVSDPRATAILGPVAGMASDIEAISITGTTAAPLSGVVVQGNIITLMATSNTTDGISITTSTDSASVNVLSNQISTGQGTALMISAGDDAATSVLVQANNFNGNAIGVDYMSQNAGSTISTDLGGGTLGSTGDNIFSSFTATGTTSNAAIVVSGAASGATLTAEQNVFGTTTPSNVVFGASNINVSNPLTGNDAFIQYLYVTILGRPATTAQMNQQAGYLNNGQQTVNTETAAVLNSAQAIDRVVNMIFVDCIGQTATTSQQQAYANEAAKGTTLETIISQIVTSTPWLQANPGRSAIIYVNNQLHRNPTAAEITTYENLESTSGLMAVPMTIVKSSEFRQDFALNVVTELLQNPTAESQAISLSSNMSMNLMQLEATEFDDLSYAIPGTGKTSTTSGSSASSSAKTTSSSGSQTGHRGSH